VDARAETPSGLHGTLLRFILIFLPKDVGFDLSLSFLSGLAGYFPLLCTSWRKSYMLKKAFKPLNKVSHALMSDSELLKF
jgi:hypothetical protein